MLEDLLKNVTEIITKNFRIDIDNPDELKLISNISKYSSTKTPTIKIFYKGNPLKRDDKLSYKCPNCSEISTILVGRFLSKKTKFCYKCKETNEEKRKLQSNYVTKSYKDFGKIRSININKKENNNLNDQDLFNSEDIEFKNRYFERHLTKSEFIKIVNNIKSINGVNIENHKVEYLPIVKTNNQMKFSPKVTIDGIINKFDNIEFYCSICGEDFRGRNIKNKFKIGFLCPVCSFSNKIFKFKSIKNIYGDNVVYQSKPEIKLINHCNSKNILIKNGPIIDYKFDGKDKKYKVDFDIPIHKILVEVKDMHIWHIEQIESGKWVAKERAAKNWSSKNGYQYYLIFDVDILMSTYL
jgi:predicted RNA-binding Zn-ribbon protein involved in translation (DUF1610 family)